MLNSLILTNGAVKHYAFICILCGTLECILTDAHRLDAYQYALGVQAVQQLTKALTFFADPIFQRHRQTIF